MFGARRSGIPVPGTAAKSSIPVVKKTNGTNDRTTNAPSRSTQDTTKSSIPSPNSRPNSSPSRPNSSKTHDQAIKPPNDDLPNDAKILKAQILDLQKKLDSKEEVLNELNLKFTMKTEECGDLIDEMSTVRRRNSVDLQQVTKDYVELQEKFQDEQCKVSEMEKSHREEKECLQLELDVMKGEQEMELQMLRKELIDVRNRSEQRGIPLEPERTRLVENYERDIQRLKEELQLQTQKVHEATDKLEEKEFEWREKVNEMTKQYEQKQGFLVAEHKAEVTRIQEKYLCETLQEDHGKTAIESLRKEHDTYVETIKEQFDIDLQQLKTEIEKASKNIELKETDAAVDLMTMRNEYETQLASLRAELKNREELSEVTESRNDTFVEQLKNEHDKSIKELQESHRKEIERIQLVSQESERSEEIQKGSLESELQQKGQLESYEHEIRNLKAELKKERVEFTEAKELLASNITDMENEMKEREEKIRRELDEQHGYEIEVLNDELDKVLHDKQKTHKHEMAEVRKEYEQLLAKEKESSKVGKKEIEESLNGRQSEHEKEIEELTLKHDLELENIQETLENLQIYHEELQTEYDLVVNDLASELETTKLKAKGGTCRSTGVLKEQIGKLKSHNENNVEHVTEELKESKRIITSLNEEISTLKSQEQNTVDYVRQVTGLQKLVSDMEAEKHHFNAIQKELDEHKDLVEKLKTEDREKETEAERKISEVQKLADAIQKENELLQINLDCVEKENETQTTAAEKKITDLQKHADRIEKENQELKKGHQEESRQKVEYEEIISKLNESIEKLEAERQTMHEERQSLRDDLENLQEIQKSEPVIIENESLSFLSESIDMIGDGGLENTEELKYDQTMKGIVEEFENKNKELEVQLAKVNQDLTAKSNRLQSVGAEMNVLRGNLENERNVVQNLEDRCEKLIEKHDLEIEQLRQKLQIETGGSRNDIEDREKQVKQEYDGLIESLRQDRETLLDTNKGLSEDANMLKKQLENVEQQLVQQEAKHVAAEIKQNDVNGMIESIQDDLIEKRKEISSLTSLLESERSEHARKVQDLEFLVEQLSSNEDKVKDLVNEVQKQQKENGSLRSELASEQNNTEERIEEFERQERTKSAEIESLASMVDTERSGHDQKIEQLEKEIRKKASEVNALSSLLEKEQASHEKTINDTQKHFAKLSEIENNNYSLEEEVKKLKSKLQKIKAAMSKKEQENNELLQRNKQLTIDELEEVQNLNRSLTEAEMHTGKLVQEVETSRGELQKTQERCNKTREKLKTMKQKWQKDHTKLEEILHSPRVDMGLQTSLIEPEEVEDTRNQLSDSMRDNSRLTKELRGSKQDLDGFKNDMYAFKRANNVLIKQNQVLYLETEGYKNTVDNLTLKMDQLRQISIKLTKDNEKLQLENEDFNGKLKRAELNLCKMEGDKSSTDALNDRSRSEIEEKKINCCRLEDENVRVKNQNDFLLSQAKRLQERVDELQNDIKQLKHDLLVKEVDIIKTERLMADKVEPWVTSPRAAHIDLSTDDSLTQKNHGLSGLHGELSKPHIDEFGNQRDTLVSQIKSFKDSVGNDGEGDKGFVGIKSYQVIEWDTNKRSDESQVNETPVPSSEPYGGHQLSRIKQLEFDSSNYLGSAYWDTMNFLKTMKSSK